MKFRPCIDIHNGKVKQIVGGSLRDQNGCAEENFVSSQDASFYAELYKENNLRGGHVILLDPVSGRYYDKSRRQAFGALKAWPGGLQIGGGITPENASEYMDAGASHVIVTSYVFQDGRIHYENLKKISGAVGKTGLVLDVSCRKKEGGYYIVTDRWQKYSKERLDLKLLDGLAEYCDEFLVHAVDREGKSAGIEEEVAVLLGEWGKLPVTYAGGVRSLEDLDRLRRLGRGRVDVTVGSALDLFGGPLEWKKVAAYMEKYKKEPV